MGGIWALSQKHRWFRKKVWPWYPINLRYQNKSNFPNFIFLIQYNFKQLKTYCMLLNNRERCKLGNYWYLHLLGRKNSDKTFRLWSLRPWSDDHIHNFLSTFLLPHSSLWYSPSLKIIVICVELTNAQK